MEHGQVRTILWRHAARATDEAGLADPNGLLPASRLRNALADLPLPEQRARGAEYAALWARTFRTLVTHLRGRPERALALFAEEVYPFLRGDRLAARVERTGAHEARVLLADDLPAAYLCGLLEGFVALSGARAHADSSGTGVFTLRFHTPAQQRLARAVAQATALRLPLLTCALLAATTGVVLAGLDGPLPAIDVAATLLGVVSAQVAANALHGLRNAPAHPFAVGLQPRAALLAQTIGGYALAAAAGTWLLLANGPLLAAFAAAGLLLGLAYAKVRASGMGPFIAAATYGLLIPAGAVAALRPALFGSAPLIVPLAGAPLGLMAAALLLLDNLADRPLDEAGGQRTLAVRLPPQRNGHVVSILLALALAALATLGVLAFAPQPIWGAILLVVPAALLARRVNRDLADPHALATARLGTFGLLVAVSLVPIVLFAGLVPLA